jgi:hypothetical protein
MAERVTVGNMCRLDTMEIRPPFKHHPEFSITHWVGEVELAHLVAPED